MPDIPKYLLSLVPQFEASLRKSYPDHNTILRFDDAAQTAISVIKHSTGIVRKIDASDIKRFVKYLQSQGAPIGIMAEGCYWAYTQAELSFSIGFIGGRKKWYSEVLEYLESVEKKMLQEEFV